MDYHFSHCTVVYSVESSQVLSSPSPGSGWSVSTATWVVTTLVWCSSWGRRSTLEIVRVSCRLLARVHTTHSRHTWFVSSEVCSSTRRHSHSFTPTSATWPWFLVLITKMT